MVNDSPRLQGLDGLRGVAILLVLIYHLWTELSGQHVLPPGSPWTFIYAGNTGVVLFFVLSGFLVSLPFIKALEHNRLPSLRLYALHRALRILPPYYFIGLIGIALTGQYQQLLPTLVFIADALDVGYYSTVWWSLSTEVQFYLLLPLLFMAAQHRLRPALLLLIGALLISVYLLVISKVIGPQLPEGIELKFRLILSVFGQMPAFAAGIMFALIYHHTPSRNISPFPAYVAMAFLIGLLGWALLPQANNGSLRFMWNSPWYVLPEALLWGAIVWVMLNRAPPPFSVLDNRITRYFGKMYLVHMPVLEQVLRHFHTSELWARFTITFTVSVALAQLCYWLVEKPSLTLKTKLSQPYLQPGLNI